MSALTVTYYPHDAGTRTFYFEKNTRDEPLTESYEEGFSFEAEVDLNQGSPCYFDGLTNLEGRHGRRRSGRLSRRRWRQTGSSTKRGKLRRMRWR
jgi:hypothetical protein